MSFYCHLTRITEIKREILEDQLEDANERISELMIIEEGNELLRDLHDTLGQKLSLIGLKSDLGRKVNGSRYGIRQKWN